MKLKIKKLKRCINFDAISITERNGLIRKDMQKIHIQIEYNTTLFYYIKFERTENEEQPSSLQAKQTPLQHLFVYKVLRIFYCRCGNIGLVYNCNPTISADLRKF